MKKIIAITTLLFTFFTVSAQKIKDHQNAHLQSNGTHFSQTVTDKSWANKNGNSYTTASFFDYSGESFAVLMPTENIDTHFAINIQLKKGEIEVILEDVETKGNLYQKKFGESQKDMVIISLEKNKTYHLKFVGKSAKGSYFSQWTEQ
ncbi:hypothetical protein GV828_12025 [Flavobacterium sp. NST-5]|uniref:Uncharacterized protein n=1 Tax=Flavobacterium ichthyis TaxID=2698827 RepID=A0ABW9ZAJ5_9FLAO|nr:hypothetical protein [Flavobacterium ichthyis]NBL65928.1 hypothetical protein [Flavobacterium ichthyis]